MYEIVMLCYVAKTLFILFKKNQKIQNNTPFKTFLDRVLARMFSSALHRMQPRQAALPLVKALGLLVKV
jgi:hypothetical protein